MSSARCLQTSYRVIVPARLRASVNVAGPQLTAAFHNSAPGEQRLTRDRNKSRGVSAIHRRYPKFPLSVANLPLPEPTAQSKDKRTIEVDPNHGLFGFFKKGDNDSAIVLPTPEEDHAHGRSWSVAELRRKSWQELHKLWWVCVKERNIMFTQLLERTRLKPGYGDFEAKGREKEIHRTQRAIKHVLTERYYAWEEAVKLARDDPTVNLSGVGPAFDPMVLEDYEVEEVSESTEAEPTTGAGQTEKLVHEAGPASTASPPTSPRPSSASPATI